MAHHETGSESEPRGKIRKSFAVWHTALSAVSPNKILVRGYPLDEMIGRVSFSESVYLLLMGELPTPQISTMFSGILVALLDHGVTPPSTVAARNVATTGAPLKDSVAAGIMAFGPFHGGDIESCMRFLDGGLSLVRAGMTMGEAAAELVARAVQQGEAPPGFGHRFHTRDPRAGRLFQMALELELDGQHVQLMREVERAIDEKQHAFGRPLPVHVDGAIAAICADLGFSYDLGNAVFLISRLPGLIAHAHEERLREAPMRTIDPSEHQYDGPSERRLPVRRK